MKIEEGAGLGRGPSDTGTLFALLSAGPWGKKVPCKGVPAGPGQFCLSNSVTELLKLS